MRVSRFARIDRLIQRTPILRKTYFNNYASIKYYFYKLNRTLHMVNTPLFVRWVATYECNLHCKHCEASAGEKRADELTTEEICRAVKEMGKMGVRGFYVSGGEPLLRKDFFEVISMAKREGMNISISTNGYLVERFEDQLSSVKPLRISTSIDGLEETNDEFRGARGAFQKTLRTLDFFKEIGVETRTIYTFVWPGNIHELEELREVILTSSANRWKINIRVPVGRIKDSQAMDLSSDQLLWLFDFIWKTKRLFHIEMNVVSGYLGVWERKLRSRPFFCEAGLEGCAIMPDGEVLGCHIVYDDRYSEGNIKAESFREIWENGFTRFRNPEFNDTCRQCKYFGACRGGCWGMRIGNRHCLREVWDETLCRHMKQEAERG
jgi:radical SAM protein with 4Fe4S-binding SPASM domain